VANRIELLIIDPQHDFCDPGGALFVKGADEDMRRLENLVRRIGKSLWDINVTMDCHHDVHIAHPVFWIDSRGQHPTPFTIISGEQVLSGEWRPSIPSKGIRQRAVDYVKALAAENRYPFVIWPPHCIIGSIGSNIVPELHEALRDWERQELATVNFVTKGGNPYVDYYSAVKAAVPDKTDITTSLNTSFIEKIAEADTVLVAGEPGSHMVAETMRDIADAIGKGADLKKFVLLTDAMSAVPSFEKMAGAFLTEMARQGMRLGKTSDF